jgi:hypothetical protein
LQNGGNKRRDGSLLSSQYIVSMAHNVIFAQNPKVMSSSSKWLISVLDGIPIKAGNIDNRPRSRFTYLNRFSQAERDTILSTFHRVLFVRNPLTRLRSAWGDKFDSRARQCASGKCPFATASWAKIAREVLRSQNVTMPESTTETMGAVTWPRFAVAASLGKVVDRHWRLQVPQSA